MPHILISHELWIVLPEAALLRPANSTPFAKFPVRFNSSYSGRIAVSVEFANSRFSKFESGIPVHGSNSLFGDIFVGRFNLVLVPHPFGRVFGPNVRLHRVYVETENNDFYHVGVVVRSFPTRFL